MRRINFSEEQMNYIIDQYTRHIKTTRELAIEFNCSRYTIERRLKENKIKLEQWYHYEDLTNKIFNDLTVISLNQKRYEEDKKITNKPHRYWFCRCKCGNIIEVESSHLKNGHTTSCGCNRSNGEKEIIELLTSNNIFFYKEYSFKDLKGVGNGILRFDFAIFNNKDLSYLIEFNGKQHYECNGGWNTEKEFNTRKTNDLLKIRYCQKNNIPLIIIPYTHQNKLCIEDLKLETTNFLYQEGDDYHQNLA